MTTSGHSGGTRRCDTAEAVPNISKERITYIFKVCFMKFETLKMKVTWYLQNDRNSLPRDIVSHLWRLESSIRTMGKALVVTKCEPAHSVRFPQSHLLSFSCMWLLLQWAVHFWWWYCGVYSSQTHSQTMWPTQKPTRASSHRRDRQTSACLTGESKSSIIKLSPY